MSHECVREDFRSLLVGICSSVQNIKNKMKKKKRNHNDSEQKEDDFYEYISEEDQDRRRNINVSDFSLL